MTLNAAYEWMTAVLDKNTHEFDDDKKKIAVKVPLNLESLIDLKRTVLQYLGNVHTPDRKWEDDPAHWGYKFDSHYIEIDEKTIQVDNYGRLFVNVEDMIDHQAIQEKVVEKLLENDELLQKLADAIIPKLIVEVPIPDGSCCTTLPPHHHHDPHHEDEDYPVQP